MILSDILKKKGNRVIHVVPGTSINETVNLMVSNKIGAVLVVTDDHNPVGIFTERDNLRVSANPDIDPMKTAVDDYMSKELVCGLPDDLVEEAMATMTEQRVRHLPVVADKKLVGLVSIGDIVKETASKYKSEIKYLKNYIQGY